MTVSVFIDGAIGTTGLEIGERLSGRAGLSLIRLDDAVRKDTAARAEAMNDADFVILCLPDDAARDAMTLIRNEHVRVIDASSAHRVVPGWTYGFAEMHEGQRQVIGNSWRVSNPGCYPTGFLALVAPLVERGLLPANHGYTVNAVSGYSGGGNALINRFRMEEPDIGFRTYALDMVHKHLAEMQVHAALDRAPLFAPSVVRAMRGMMVEVPLFLDSDAGFASARELHDALSAHYLGEPLANVMPMENTPAEILLSENMVPSDALTLHVLSSADGSQVRLIAVLDNLGKGASGAAVQNLNIMAGLDELAGLRI
ncbi:N-acetyl-gamma-glutamyl-phosphate reductase [Sphingorhabdus sp. Alg239-R122]|uniref:N-acetyl-gamma-glutamyl-phosphate reductase n=1 Tax=Sphingorhabdus sp. Alg239-R122 TaxID=2305989 RepID=UPI0013DBF4CA|nr:N-acetyl-gamma-glutamyl-phosphate reductase [Sphingorhabdus sp. Alg239-R122]